MAEQKRYQDSVSYYYDDVRGAGGRRHRAFKSKLKGTGAHTLRKLAEWIVWARDTSATRWYFKEIIRFYPETNSRDYDFNKLTQKELKELAQLVDEVKLEKLLEGAGVSYHV